MPTLQVDPDISNSVNSLIFKAVQDFIAQIGRFSMDPNSKQTYLSAPPPPPPPISFSISRNALIFVQSSLFIYIF